MSHQSFLDFFGNHPRFSLALFLILSLFQIDTSEGKDIWCCRGWSDDVGKPGQVETFFCGYTGVCRGETSCTESANKDCATVWGCGESFNGTYPNKTDDDCTKPEVGKECYCDKPWCNCPQSLKNKEMPRNSDKLKCCYGSSTDPPEKLLKKQCDLRSFSCLGQTLDNNVTNFNCGETNNGRVRANCYGFSSPKKYGDGSNFCRCSTDYCNCPKRSGGEKTSSFLSANTRFALASVFLLLKFHLWASFF